MKHKTCTIIRIKAPQSQNNTIPVILLNHTQQISETTLKYSLMLIEQKISDSNLNTYLRVLAKLYDFYHNQKPKFTYHKLFLDHFIKELQNPKKLTQKPLTKSHFNHHIIIIRNFTKWLITHQNLIKDKNEQQFLTMITVSYKFLEQNNHKSMLFQDKTHKSHFSTANSTTILRSFPTQQLFNLLKTAPIRDQLLLSFLAFAGRRPAEVLNLFTSDITTDQNRLQSTIYHPSESTINNVSRKEYLKQFTLEPRNEITNNFYTGFKGIKFENQKQLSSESYFILDMDYHLVNLHHQYLKLRSQYKVNHPYYFINLKDGSPLTLYSLKYNFKELCKSIDLKVNEAEGINLLGLRHFYGSYCSQVLKLDHLEIKRLLHQISVKTSLSYFNNKDIIWNEMNKVVGYE